MIEEKNEIQSSAIRRFMNHFSKHKLNSNNPNTITTMKKIIATVFQQEVEELGLRFSEDLTEESDILLKYINDQNVGFSQNTTCDRIKNAEGTYNDAKPAITINNYRYYENLQSDIPELRLETCKKLFQGIFHEFEHYRQYLKMQSNVSSKEGIRYARDWVISDSGLADSKIYKDNYANFFIENAANEKSYIQYNLIMEEGFSQNDINAKTRNMIFSTYAYDFGDGIVEVEDRNDMSVRILDDLIISQNKTELLLMYPMLQKEYNLDGTKKNIQDLVRDMKAEASAILSDSTLSEDEKTRLSKDANEMYYELICRAMQREDNKDALQLLQVFSREEIQRLVSDMQQYFLTEKRDKIEALNEITTLDDKFVLPANKGTIRDESRRKIEVDRDGKRVLVLDKDFLEMINPELLDEEIKVRPTVTKTGREFLKEYFYRYLPESGEYVLKDGTIISAQDFIENYVLQQEDFSQIRPISTAIYSYLKDTIMSKTEAEKIIASKRITEHYDKKVAILEKVKEQIRTPDKSTGELTEQEKRMKFVQGFIQAYNDTETEYQYNTRLNDEQLNLQRVQEIIDTNGLDRTLTVDLDGKWMGTPQDDDFKVQYSQKQVSAMARLLKAAQLLTDNRKLNPSGRNYLEEFSAIPDIEYKLKQMQKDLKDDSTYIFELRKLSRNNREKGALPDFPATPGEIDAYDTPSSRHQGLKQEIGMSVAQTEKISIKTVKTAVEKSKITTSETQEQTKKMGDIYQIKKLLLKKQLGQQLTPEEQQIIEPIEKNSQERAKRWEEKKDNGMSI